MQNSPPAPAAGAASAVASLITVGLAAVVGGLGTIIAYNVVPVTWSDTAQLSALSAPSVVALALAAVGMVAGMVAIWRGGLGRWPGWLGVLGLMGGVLTLVGAGSWLLFLGGLITLAAFAWH